MAAKFLSLILGKFFLALFVLLFFAFLIALHEWGHAYTAHKLGIKIKRFAIGFGKVIGSFTAKRSQIEYVFCLFPLGGYIKFDDQKIYDSSPIYKRALIIFAGPFYNLVFAFLAYWAVFFIGIHSLSPVIKTVLPHSPAEFARLPEHSTIMAIDHRPVHSWPAVLFKLLPHLGRTQDAVIITVMNPGDIKPTEYPLKSNQWSLDPVKPNFLSALGITPDTNAPILTRQYGLFSSARQSLSEIQLYLTANVIILTKLLTGALSLSSLGGPISLFSTSFHAAHQGTASFIAFGGFLSTGLFFVNLLPVPGLDGGHLLYLLIEKIRKKPLSIRLQMLLFQLGIIFICVIMFQALINDLVRLF